MGIQNSAAPKDNATHMLDITLKPPKELGQHPAIKPINIPTGKYVNIQTKWENNDYKWPLMRSGQVLQAKEF